jgi:phage terminase small subunit
MGGVALTPKQQRFVQEYLVDLNATQAAIRAGYSARAANTNGPRMLVDAGIAAAIAEAQKARGERTGITADRVLTELARLAFADGRRLYRPDGTLKLPHEWDDDTAASVAGVETQEQLGREDGDTPVVLTRKVKRWDKKGSLELLGRHLGLFKDKVEVSGPGGGPIQLTDAQRAEAVAALFAKAAARLKADAPSRTAADLE